MVPGAAPNKDSNSLFYIEFYEHKTKQHQHLYQLFRSNVALMHGEASAAVDMNIRMRMQTLFSDGMLFGSL
jgi:hypothetical protein